MPYPEVHLHSQLAISRKSYDNPTDPVTPFNDSMNVVLLENLRHVPPLGNNQPYLIDPTYDSPYGTLKLTQQQPEELTLQFNFTRESWANQRLVGSMLDYPRPRAFRLLLNTSPMERAMLANHAARGVAVYWDAMPVGWSLAPSVSDVTIGTLSLMVLHGYTTPRILASHFPDPTAVIGPDDQGSFYDSQRPDLMNNYSSPVVPGGVVRQINSSVGQGYIQVTQTPGNWRIAGKLYYWDIGGNWRVQLPNSGRSGWIYMAGAQGITKIPVPVMDGSFTDLPTGQYSNILVIDRDLTPEEESNATAWMANRAYLFHTGVLNDQGIWNDATVWS